MHGPINIKFNDIFLKVSEHLVAQLLVSLPHCHFKP